MNRLDRHIGAVRSKLAFEQFLLGLGYAVAIFFALVLASVLVDRFLWVHLPRVMIWFWAGLGMAVAAAIGFSVLRRPTAHQAAIFIDEKLGLKEKFSTALYARGGNDPFALAAVKDAERTAENVSLHRRFPISIPNSGYLAIGVAVVVLLIALLLPRFDLFGRQEKLALAKKQATERQEARHQAQSVLASVNSLPVAMQNKQQVELAKRELQHVMDQPLVDPSIVKLTAQKAQEEADTAKQEEIKNNQAFAQAMADKAVFNSLNPTADEKGPVADASRAIADADFSKAIDVMQGLPDKFNQMTPEDQKKATDQMQAMADQLKKIASDPAAMQHLQQQLKQQGITPQQIQQMAKAVQQAAQGNQQAQQQLQQMQQQIAQQMNGGKGPTQQQQQAIQKAMQQMQQVASSQAKAQQMKSAAQQMAQGMQQAQAAKQGGTQAGQAQANAKMGGAQQQGQQQGGSQSSGQQGGSQQASASKQGGQQAGGQQPGGQQAGGQQGSGQQSGGQQPGGQGQGDGQQQMQQAGQQMAQALGQMDAVQKDAEEQEAARNNPGNQAGQNNPGQGQQPQAGNKPGGGGNGGPTGHGGPGHTELAQFTVKQEIDASQNIENGKVLARSFVKADQVIGKSTIELSPAAKAAVKDSTDDVSEDTVPKDAQKAVKDYFDTVNNDH